MKIKRRWKAMTVLPMIWFIIAYALFIPLYKYSFEDWIAAYGDSLLLFGGWFIGTITGVLLFWGAIDAEERENKDNEFKDNVYSFYIGMLSAKPAEESINETAIQFDISPSGVRSIVKGYEDG